MIGGNYSIFVDSKNSIEDPTSNFNQHRREVIKYSIEKNLSTAIANYNNYTDSTNNFQMPKLKETDWDDLVDHISIISFLQGLNIGGKVYNGYSIITNTKNKEVVSNDSIYILSNEIEESGVIQTYYHKPTETGLINNSNVTNGVLNIDLERRSIITLTETKYYYPIYALGSYSSIVSQNTVEQSDNIYKYLSDNKNSKVAQAYFTALGRERYNMYRTANDYDKLKNEQK